MARAPFQSLVIPYRRNQDGTTHFAVLQRADDARWQFISGGGEDDETPQEAAIREAAEEASISQGALWMRLDSMSTVPRAAFPGGSHWPSDLYVVREHCFAVDATAQQLKLSTEHQAIEWLEYEQAVAKLSWQSNKNALWELRERLGRSGLQRIDRT